MSSLLKTQSVFDGSAYRPTRGRIRAVTESDFGPIVSLYEHALGPLNGTGPLLKRIFFQSPWRDGSLSSLVYEDHKGHVVGCLGVMPRPMRFQGRDIRAAVGHHLLVQNSPRGTRAGVELARHFVNGPQDLAVAAGNEFARRIWEFVGGSVSPFHSLSWTRSLRPAQYALTQLKRRGLPATAAVTLNPACQAVDATLNIIAQSAVGLKRPTTFSDDLDAVTMLACLSVFTKDWPLQPIYDVETLNWLVETLDASTHGKLHKVAVRTHSGRLLGWYLYELGQSGVAEVLQIGGREDTAREVLHHLFYHARRRGAVAVNGSMEARLFPVLSESHCVFHRPQDSWTLFHSADPRISESIRSGGAFISRLEGAWWGAA